MLLRLLDVLDGDLALLDGALAAFEKLGDPIAVALGHVYFLTFDFLVGGLILTVLVVIEVESQHPVSHQVLVLPLAVVGGLISVSWDLEELGQLNRYLLVQLIDFIKLLGQIHDDLAGDGWHLDFDFVDLGEDFLLCLDHF